MTTVSQIVLPPLTGNPQVDALLAGNVTWNALGRNVIHYSFALGSDDGDATNQLFSDSTASAFTATQQARTRDALAYVSHVTGIEFQETANASAADLHFVDAQLYNDYACQESLRPAYTANPDGTVSNVAMQAWIYLDSGEADNLTLTAGSYGYESLLHELEAVLGLKNPATGTWQLPPGNALGQDNTLTTLMSLNEQGTPATAYRFLDLAVLEWLYGGDGLGGTHGAGAPIPSVIGTVGADALYGGSGNDRLFGGPGNDTIDGGAGTDTAIFMGDRSAYSVGKSGNVITVSGTEGVDTLANVERLEFNDSVLAFDITGNAGMAYRLYRAAFDRAPDLPGLGFHIETLDHGLYITQAAAHFVESPEFQAKYGTLSNTEFVRQLYLNVLDREPDAAGLAYHVHNLETNATRADVLAGFSESPENQAAVIGIIGGGIVYIDSNI